MLVGSTFKCQVAFFFFFFFFSVLPSSDPLLMFWRNKSPDEIAEI